jgi:hypothetical protein
VWSSTTPVLPALPSRSATYRDGRVPQCRLVLLLKSEKILLLFNHTVVLQHGVLQLLRELLNLVS